MTSKFSVVSFYEFKLISDVENTANEMEQFCISRKLHGSIILAQEGINGSIAGHSSSVNGFILYLRKLNFNNLNSKISESPKMPFYRLKIKIKKEIITMLGKPLDPHMERGNLVDAAEWNQVITRKDTIVVDVRNEYETRIGSFQNAIIPKIENFKEFKEFIDTQLIQYKDKRIAMFCTGGIRCEKASYYMNSLGFENVVQLNGGILKYLEGVSESDSKWQGECFVFDERVTLKHALEVGKYNLCRGCSTPVSPEDVDLVGYEKDVSCANCFDSTNDGKKNSSRERSKQIALAEKRGEKSVYLPGPLETFTPLN